MPSQTRISPHVTVADPNLKFLKDYNFATKNKLYNLKLKYPTFSDLISCKCSVTGWLSCPMCIHSNYDMFAQKQLVGAFPRVGVLHHFTLITSYLPFAIKMICIRSSVARNFKKGGKASTDLQIYQKSLATTFVLFFTKRHSQKGDNTP